MRKLAVGSGAFSAGIFISYYLYDPVLWPVISGMLLICFLLCISVRKNIGMTLRLFLLMCTLGLTYFSVYHAVAEKTAEAYISSESCTAVVSDFPEEYDNYTRVKVSLYGSGGRCSALIYDYYKNTGGLTPGDRIMFSANFRSMISSDSAVSDSNISKGIMLTGRLTSDVAVLGKGTHALHISKYLSHTIYDKIPEVFPDDTVPFLRALLLGRKTDLYSDNSVYPAFLRSGFMHTVAISGMHISFIAGFCIAVFGNNRRGSVISLILIWLFVFMSGNTPSAARAGIMQTVLLMAPFFRRENDTVTSLALALSVLLVINPFAAGSISLQLSFGAVLGIVIFSSRINEALHSALQSETIKRVLRYPIGIISASIGVMAFTVPLSALHFGYVSFLSFITNVFALWAVPVCFCGAYLCLILYMMMPVTAQLIAGILAYLCRYIFYVCSAVSGIPYAVIPYEGRITLLLFALIYVLFIIFGFSSFSALKKLLIPAGFSVILVLSYFLFFRVSADSAKATFTVIDAGQGECVAAFSGNRAVVIDCGTSDYFRDPVVDCADYLYSRGQKNIDALMLTHLHSDHVNGVCRLMELIDVSNVFIPVNAEDTDEYFLLIKKTAERTGSRIILVDADSALNIGDIEAELYPSYILTDTNESCMAIKLSAFDRSFLVTGDGTYINEMILSKKDSIGDIDVLVAGHHGADGSSCTYFLQRTDPEYSVISVGKNNSYGHPSVYAIERMLSEGIAVFRTDLCGRVSFIIN